MFAFQTPFTLAPGHSITLRYAYGYAHPDRVAGMIAKYAAQAHPLRTSERRWSAWLPKVGLGPDYTWLSRESQWDAYTVRSDATYDEMCGYHTLSQGGYYQYWFGFQGAFRDPLQHMLPMIWSDPWLARQVIEYSAHEQPEVGGQIPYALISGCRRYDLGTSDDLDLWLLWGTAEYVLDTRDYSLPEHPGPVLPGRRLGHALGPPQARLPEPGARRRPRPAQRVPDRRHGRLERLLDRVQPDDRVGPRDRPGRLHVPAAGARGGPRRRHRVRGAAPRRRRRAISAHRPGPVRPGRLVRAGSRALASSASARSSPSRSRGLCWPAPPPPRRPPRWSPTTAATSSAWAPRRAPPRSAPRSRRAHSDPGAHRADRAARQREHRMAGRLWFAVNGWWTWALASSTASCRTRPNDAWDEFERNTLDRPRGRVPGPLGRRDLRRRRVRRLLPVPELGLRDRPHDRRGGDPRIRHADHAPARLQPVPRCWSWPGSTRPPAGTGSSRTCRRARSTSASPTSASRSRRDRSAATSAPRAAPSLMDVAPPPGVAADHARSLRRRRRRCRPRSSADSFSSRWRRGSVTRPTGR